MSQNKALTTLESSLALIGVDAGAAYWPSVMATTEDAHQLTKAILALALHTLEREREAGSELPDVKIADTETGELTMNPAYEVMLRERALTYLQTMGMEGEASTFEILAEIEARSLYMWGEQPWESLSQFVRNLGTDKSPAYASVWERMATHVLPVLQVKKVAGVKEIMDLIVGGGKSNLSFLLPELMQAADEGDKAKLKTILADARLPRSEWWEKYKGEKVRVPPASAVLRHSNPEWELTIRMNDAQKRVVLSRLGPRIEYE